MDEIAGIAEILEEARNGRMFVLVDDEDRENEGDLVIPAQMATPDAINFMARHGRGLICLAITAARADRLGLGPMAQSNRCANQTAFTVSIEAREGVTTGISAQDRARTIAVAVNDALGPDAIVTPGHVFPLVAREGGVLVRAGHTEAGVDVSRLAGLNPSAVICEIMNPDGTMARLPELVAFAGSHGIKIGTIRDLISYRMRHDHYVSCVAETRFDSLHGGEWLAKTFRDSITGSEHIVLQKGDIDPEEATLVRMHAASPFHDSFGEISVRSGQLQRAMEIIAEEGRGVVIYLQNLAPDAMSEAFRRRQSGPPLELREYGIGAQILSDLNVRRMTLLTDGSRLPVSLSGYNLELAGRRPIFGGSQGANTPAEKRSQAQ